MYGAFTMIIAGSGLPWVQIRSDRSSDALNHHCLLRLQLTLLTSLSWPAYKERFETNLERQCAAAAFLFMVLFRESGRVKRRGSLWPTRHLNFCPLFSAAPLWRLCSRCTWAIKCETDNWHAWIYFLYLSLFTGPRIALSDTSTVCMRVRNFISSNLVALKTQCALFSFLFLLSPRFYWQKQKPHVPNTCVGI